MRHSLSDCDGQIPSDPRELIKLPGVGPYTAGAVACFAYEKDTVFLDTNMRRVLHRYFFGLQARTPMIDKELLLIATELVPQGRGWRWNQALMETGALLSTVRSPRCEECPLREGCRARGEAATAGWPRPQRRPSAHRYEDSNRCYRGRVPAELRRVSHSDAEGIALRELGPRIKKDFDERDLSWLRIAVESLCKDGLAKVERVPEVRGMIAEDHTPYQAGAEVSQSPSLDERVCLP